MGRGVRWAPWVAIAATWLGCQGDAALPAAGGVADVGRRLVARAEAAPPPPPSVALPAETFPHLDDEPAAGAVSSGDTSHGRLFQARRLEESSSLAILDAQRARDLRWGTDDLIDLLDGAAARVHGATGTRLWVGNLGRRAGGDIAWSVSHNAGRDADVAFFVVDATGAPVDPPDLVPLGRDGWSKDRTLRFDAARTWLAVRAMLEHPRAQVQYLFASAPLIRLLLDDARARGEPARLVARATDVLRQPSGSAPHDDHLHVRIRCSQRDVAGGCVDGGPVHPWQRTFGGVREERARTAAATLRASSPDARRRAALRLALLDARPHADAVAARMDDTSAAVRAAAARALGVIGGPRHAPLLAARFAAESDVEVLLSILAGAAGIGGPQAGALLADAIGADPGPIADSGPWPLLQAGPPPEVPAPTGMAPAALRLGPPWVDASPSPFFALAPPPVPVDRGALREAAIALASRADASEPAAPLAELLGAGDAALRGRAAAALEGVANRSLGEFMDPHASEATLAAAAARWGDVVRGLGTSPRDVWIATGFLASGYRVPAVDRKHAWELVRAVSGTPFASRAARRWLARLEGGVDPGLGWSAGEACRHWMSWFEARHRRYRIERTPDTVKRACWGAPR